MPTGFFLTPYETRRDLTRPRRVCAMDNHNAALSAWSESEIDGDQAVVKVRATSRQLFELGLIFTSMTRAEASAVLSRATRKLPAYDRGGDRIIFREDARKPVKTFARLDSEISESKGSGELRSLVGLWLGLGFGLGWRVPYSWASWLALKVGEPNDYWRVLLSVVFSEKGAFGDTGILDNFNRADEDPLSDGGNWGSLSAWNGNSLRLVSNAAEVSAGGQSGGYRSDTTYGPDSEAYATLSTIGASSFGGIFTRITNPGGSLDAYEHQPLSINNTAILQVISGGGETQAGASVAYTPSAGDLFGGESIGSDHAVYVNTGAGWSQLLTRNDTTHTAAGNIGMWWHTGGWRLDDFSGGTIAAAAASFIYNPRTKIRRILVR